MIQANQKILAGVIVALMGTTVAVAAVQPLPPSAETETGTLTARAVATSDTSASGGQAVKFTAAGGFQANCINQPSVCGYPDATNTGVPSGTTLTNSGSITVNTNGAIVENRNISGQIIIRANNVTIRNVRLTSSDYYPIDYNNNNTGLVVQDTEIIGTSDNVTACMSFGNYTVLRVRCTGGADGFKADSNVVIEDSHISNLRESAGTHNDAVQTTGGSNVTLRHNTIDLRGDAAEVIQLGTEWANNSNWLVENNLIAGGGWVFNSGSDTIPGMIIRNNRFAGTRGYGIGQPNGSSFTGNYYDTTGAAVCTGGGC